MDAKRGGLRWGGWARCWGFVLALAMCVTACGGEEGVGSGGSGITVGFGEGTVTTLGSSVALDGTGFDTTKAVVQTETSPGVISPAQVKLGQHIEFAFKVDRVADVVRVEPYAVGPVGSTAIGLVVLGQQVQINTNPALGPVTVFAGYAGLNDVLDGDMVEVHGLSRRDASGSYLLQATRVERLAAAPQIQRLTGIVTQFAVEGAVTSFMIGDEVVVVPPGTEVAADVARLADGQTVTVFGREGARGFEASFVRIKNRQNAGIDAYFGGTLAQVGGTPGSFELNGVPVRFDAIDRTVFQPADQQYVQLRGNFAIDGSLDVTAVSLLGTSGVDAGVEIKGPIQTYDPSSATALVSGYLVRMGGGQRQNCFNGIGVGVSVSVRGQMVVGGIVADRVRCLN